MAVVVKVCGRDRDQCGEVELVDEPVDAGALMWYREDKKGQILEEGINEAGSYCSWLTPSTTVIS